MPGPADYTFNPMMTMKCEPRTMIATARYTRTMGARHVSPGPSDYSVNKDKFLKQQPRAIMAKSPYNRTLAPREKSPGPQDYAPNKLLFKKRSSVVAFFQQKRGTFVNKDAATSPGPGAYKLPCKFYERPTYNRLGSSAFRFV